MISFKTLIALTLAITSSSAMDGQSKSSFWNLPVDHSPRCITGASPQSDWCKFEAILQNERDGEAFIALTPNNTRQVAMLSNALSHILAPHPSLPTEDYVNESITPLYGNIQFIKIEDIALSYKQINKMCTQPKKIDVVLTRVDLQKLETLFCQKVAEKVAQGQGEEKLKAYKFNLNMPPVDTARKAAKVELYLIVNPATAVIATPITIKQPTKGKAKARGAGIHQGISGCNGYIIDSQNKRHVILNGTVIPNQPSRGLVAPGQSECYGFTVDSQGQYLVVEKGKVVK
jgi:hypothetical protein